MVVAGTHHVISPVGICTVSSLADKHADLWDGARYVPTRVRRVETPVRMLQVTTSDGNSIRCGPDHIFYVPSLQREEGFRKPVAASRLHRGLRLARARHPAVDANIILRNPYMQGAYSVLGRESHDARMMDLTGPTGPAVAVRCGLPDDEEADISGKIDHPKSHVPGNTSMTSKMMWLRGFLDALGEPVSRGKACSVSFRDQRFVKEVANLVLSCGLVCTLETSSRGDTARLSLTPSEASKLAGFLADGKTPAGPAEPAEGGRRIILLSNPVARAAKKAPPPVYVRSVRPVGHDMLGYDVGSAFVL